MPDYSLEFMYHPLNKLGKQKLESIEIAYLDLIRHLETLCADDEDYTTVKMFLLNACFHSKKSMSNNEENQSGEVND